MPLAFETKALSSGEYGTYDFQNKMNEGSHRFISSYAVGLNIFSLGYKDIQELSRMQIKLTHFKLNDTTVTVIPDLAFSDSTGSSAHMDFTKIGVTVVAHLSENPEEPDIYLSDQPRVGDEPTSVSTGEVKADAPPHAILNGFHVYTSNGLPEKIKHIEMEAKAVKGSGDGTALLSGEASMEGDGAQAQFTLDIGMVIKNPAFESVKLQEVQVDFEPDQKETVSQFSFDNCRVLDATVFLQHCVSGFADGPFPIKQYYVGAGTGLFSGDYNVCTIQNDETQKTGTVSFTATDILDGVSVTGNADNRKAKFLIIAQVEEW
jgi:hypothetical protein